MLLPAAVLTSAATLLAQQPAVQTRPAAGALELEIVPAGPDPAVVEDFKAGLAQHPAVKARLGGALPRLLSFQLLHAPEKDAVTGTPFEAYLFDYQRNQAYAVSGDLERPDAIQLAESDRILVPNGPEYADALTVIEEDPLLGAALRSGELMAYMAMPPVLENPQADGRHHRTLAIGLLPQNGARLPHQIVGVDMIARRLLTYPDNAPPHARANALTCNPPPSANQSTSNRGLTGSVVVRARLGGIEYWRFLVTRPSDSTGTNASGVDLRNVYFRGKKVLTQAHASILNVNYDTSACGPYRDWLWEEGMFTADGTDVAPGIRRCSTPAQTILDSGSDSGNFRGVAIYVDGNNELVLVSEMEAGWYRYVSEWRFRTDGTLLPRFGFDGVQNSCTCRRHHHHVYWRMDFDLGSDLNDRVQEYNEISGVPQVTDLAVETDRLRSGGTNRSWRVQNSTGAEFYSILPGANDGFTNAYAPVDFYALRYHPGQVDDGHATWQFWRTAEDIGKFEDGEDILDQDVVVWYAAHFTHDDQSPNNHIVGPTLAPANW
ncbi:MAG: hypothetical protein EYC70_01730 [Planctomycetota bacterium]|nr:MAG: hypothetical protein EYC70_01730 [Planctomycetota bacterium]